MPYKFSIVVDYPDSDVGSHEDYVAWVQSQIGTENFNSLSAFLASDESTNNVMIDRADDTTAMAMVRMYERQTPANAAHTSIQTYMSGLGSALVLSPVTEMAQEEFDSYIPNYQQR